MTVVLGAWERMDDDLRSAMIECGKENWAGIYDGVATLNKQWRPLRSPVMTREQYGEITGLALRLMELVLGACQRRAATAGELRARLDVPAGPFDLLDVGTPLTEDLIVSVRPDVLMSGGVPKFVECNVGSSLGGAFDSDGVAQRFLAAYAASGLTDFTAPESAVDTRFHAMKEQLGLADGATSAIVFHMQGDYPGTQDGHTLIKRLEPVRDRGREAGLDVVVYPLEWLTLNSDGRLCAGPVVLDSVLRMFIPQAAPEGTGLDALTTALGTGAVEMFTPAATWLLSNKTILAWLWADADSLPSADAELIKRNVPFTELLVADGIGRARERRVDLVLKPTGDYGGSGVVVGRDVTPERWDEALRAAVAAGRHLVQEYVPADLLAMHFVELDTGDVREAEVPYCVAPYLFGGRAAGALVRFAVPDAAWSVVNMGQGALTTGLLLTDR